MAEEKIYIPANPDKDGIKSYHSRRYSTGNLSITKEEVKILPRYLRVSLGSCHDFCKYGIEDTIEKKTRSSIPRITERSGEVRDQIKDVIIEERNKKSLIKLKPKALLDSKSPTNDKNHQVIKKDAQVSAKKVAVSKKRLSLPGDIRDVSTEHDADLRTKIVQTKPFSVSMFGNSSSRRYSHISTSEGVGVLQDSSVGGSKSGGNSYINSSKEMTTPLFRKKENTVPSSVSLSFRPSMKRELSAKCGNYKDPKSLSLLKSHNNATTAECQIPIDEDIPEKTLYIIETKTNKPTGNVVDTTCFSPSLSPSYEDKKVECGRNGICRSRSPPSFENKQLRNSRNGGHATQPSSPSSLSTYKKCLRSTQNGNHSTSTSSTSSETMGSTIMPEAFGMVSLDEKVGSPQKLNFRRGKVVDVLSKNTSPRKLRYKQTRVVSCENQNGTAESKPRSLKELVPADEFSGSKTEPTQIVLRHLDVEGKKWGLHLFNNVIEETASKLAQTRKSKVRALVDAFETVISLQDKKSLATTNAY